MSTPEVASSQDSDAAPVEQRGGLVDEILVPVPRPIADDEEVERLRMAHPPDSDRPGALIPPEIGPWYIAAVGEGRRSTSQLPRNTVRAAAAAFAAHDASLRSYLAEVDAWYVPVPDHMRLPDVRQGGENFVEVLEGGVPFLSFRGRVAFDEFGRWLVHGHHTGYESNGRLYPLQFTRGSDGWVRTYASDAGRGLIRPEDDALSLSALPIPNQAMGREYASSLTILRVSELVQASSDDLVGWIDEDGFIALCGPLTVNGVRGNYGVRVTLDANDGLVPRSLTFYSGRFGMVLGRSVLNEYASINGLRMPTRIWQIGLVPMIAPEQLDPIIEAEAKNHALPEHDRTISGIGNPEWERLLERVFGPDGPSSGAGPFGWACGEIRYLLVNEKISDDIWKIEAPNESMFGCQRRDRFLRSDGESLILVDP